MTSLRALKATRNSWINIGSGMELSFVKALSSPHLQIFAKRNKMMNLRALKAASRNLGATLVHDEALLCPTSKFSPTANL